MPGGPEVEQLRARLVVVESEARAIREALDRLEPTATRARVVSRYRRAWLGAVLGAATAALLAVPAVVLVYGSYGSAPRATSDAPKTAPPASSAFAPAPAPPTSTPERDDADRTASPAPPASSPVVVDDHDCTTPYYYDPSGIRHYKESCLGSDDVTSRRRPASREVPSRFRAPPPRDPKDDGNCETPYYYNDAGIRHYKSKCLGL